MSFSIKCLVRQTKINNGKLNHGSPWGQICTEKGVCLSILPIYPYHLDLCLVHSSFSNDFYRMNVKKGSGVSLRGDISTVLKLISELFRQRDTYLLAQICEIKMQTNYNGRLSLLASLISPSFSSSQEEIWEEILPKCQWWVVNKTEWKKTSLSLENLLWGLGWQIGQHYSIVDGCWDISTSRRFMRQLIRNVYLGCWGQGWFKKTS